jgi:6-phosphofructokinase 1
MVDYLVAQGIDLLFCVGGDGTQRGASAIAAEIAARGLQKAIVGVPKTIDNDVPFNDRSFGMVTAVEEAQNVLIQAHTEARAVNRGIGLVKVMGRDAGFIACGAALASQVANFVLIPEVPLHLEGDRGFLNALAARMERSDHAVIVVAEGAGQALFANLPVERDRSGNVLKHDVGTFLRQRIAAFFRDRGAPVDVKYIDPSYLVRSVPADCDDRILCDLLARHAAHAAMAGRTNTLICYRNQQFMHVPISLAVATRQSVDTGGEIWSAVLATTGQSASWS